MSIPPGLRITGLEVPEQRSKFKPCLDRLSQAFVLSSGNTQSFLATLAALVEVK